jgi:hypothetical protein
VNIHETASVVLADTNDHGRVTVDGVFDSFGEGVLITNVAFDANGSYAYFATSDGALEALSVATITVSQVDDVGAGAWTLALYAATGRVAVVNGMQTDASGTIVDPGGVTLTLVGGSAAKANRSHGVGAPSWDEPGSGSISRPVGCSGPL